MLYALKLVELSSQDVHPLVNVQKKIFSPRFEVGQDMNPFSNKLEGIDTGSGNFANFRRISNHTLEGSSTKKTSTFSKNECRTDEISE